MRDVDDNGIINIFYMLHPIGSLSYGLTYSLSVHIWDD